MTQSIWEQLDSLDEPTLARLTEAAVEVLAPSAGEDILERKSPSRAANELRDELATNGVAVDPEQAKQLVQTDEPKLTVAILRELGREPELAREIENAFEARGRMMFGDPVTLALAALLIGVLKLKRVKAGNVEVDFYEAKSGVLQTVSSWLS